MQAPDILGGRYELRGVLGRGGMAEVRDGWDLRLNRPVAVKLLHPVVGAQPQNRDRFEVEARAAAALNHPHIVAVHDSGEHHGTPYIVMERLSGQTVAELIAHGPLPQEQVAAILDDVLSALAAAHVGGVLHRDIKPGNLLLTDRGDVKVADFGIAKSGAAVQTATGQIVGTLAYLSPDRIAGRPATVADDLYAAAVVGYEALTGRRPFPQENIVELARAIADHRPPPVAALRPDVTPGLAATVDRAMAPDPQWRFNNADEMRASLHQPVAVRSSTRVLEAPLPDPAAAAPVPVRPSRTRVVLGVGAVLAAVLLAVVLVAVDTGPTSAPVEPAGTTTPAPVVPVTTAPAPSSSPTTTAESVPVPVEQEPAAPRQGNGNGNGKKPKGHG